MLRITGAIVDFFDGPDRGRTARLSEGRHLIGRGADATIKMPATDQSVSRHQAHLTLSPSGCLLTPVTGASAVTLRNGEPANRECEVWDNDTLRVGQTRLRISLIVAHDRCD